MGRLCVGEMPSETGKEVALGWKEPVLAHGDEAGERGEEEAGPLWYGDGDTEIGSPSEGFGDGTGDALEM